MPIHVPGVRSRRGKVKSHKRSAVAVLQLTAMVDMFTVMCVFLLQNYATTNQILPLSESVALPKASAVKELRPSSVIVVAKDKISVDSTAVYDYQSAKAQEDWLLKPVKEKLEELIRKGEEEKAGLGQKFRAAVTDKKEGEEDNVDPFRKITLQADKDIDFLTIKKVMYTATQAGIFEINFAVIKKPEEKKGG